MIFPPGPPIAGERLDASFFQGLTYADFDDITAGLIGSIPSLITSYMANHFPFICFGGTIGSYSNSFPGNGTIVDLKWDGNVPHLEVLMALFDSTHPQTPWGAIPLADICNTAAYLSQSFIPPHSPPPRVCVKCEGPLPRGSKLRPSFEQLHSLLAETFPDGFSMEVHAEDWR